MLGLVLGALLALHAAWGQDAIDEVNKLNRQVEAFRSQGRIADALPLAERASALLRQTLGPEHVEVATSLSSLGSLYLEAGQYAKAEPPLQEALSIRRRALGNAHPDVAACLLNLGVLYLSSHRYEQARASFREALGVSETLEGGSHPLHAAALNNLALLHQTLGEYPQAEPLYERALEIRRQALGESHPDFCASLSNLALFYQLTGQFDKAQRLFAQAAETTRNVGGAGTRQYAGSLTNLAGLYHSLGQYVRAKGLYGEALAIYREAHLEESTLCANVTNNLGLVCQALGESAEAERLLQQAADTRKRLLGESHLDYAVSLNNLAWLYEATGQYAKSEPLYRQALSLRKAAAGEAHPDYATTLHNLARLYQETANYSAAEPLYLQALDLRRRVLGESHPDYATSLSDLAGFYAAKGDPKSALDYRRRGNAVDEQQAERVFSFCSETEKLAYLAMVQGRMYASLSLVSEAFATDPEAVRWAFGLTVRGKGRVLSSLAQQQQSSRQDPQLAARYDQWRALRRQFAAIVLRSAGQSSPEEYRQRLQALTGQAERLEAELSRLSAAFALEANTRAVDAEAIAQRLPPQSALVEIVCTPFVNAKPSGDEPRWLPAHYLAFVLTEGGSPKLVDLGDANSIDESVADWRGSIDRAADLVAAFGEPAVEERSSAPARALYEALFAPLEPELKGVEKLFVGLDGQLNLIPFEALVDSQNRYLVERYCFNYVCSGRDLLGFGRESRREGAFVVFADPEFGEVDSEKPADSARQRVDSPTRALGLSGFAPLKGTGEEARAIAQLLADRSPQVFVGREASEDRVKSLSAPRLLHLATHGFFLEDQDLPQAAEGGGSDTERQQRLLSLGIQNPLLRSGLALAGANEAGRTGNGSSEDGLLTAMDVSGCDLRGTDLVVLSACDTGLGEVRTGEGVFGLRRAFLQAGAKTLIMSLARVPDRETRELMVEFYQRWLAGADKVSALREAELALIHRRRQAHGAAHPLFWGAFIALGDPH
jgi:CHAT domain-containing protein/Tfp pilus assembly protein PilF